MKRPEKASRILTRSAMVVAKCWPNECKLRPFFFPKVQTLSSGTSLPQALDSVYLLIKVSSGLVQHERKGASRQYPVGRCATSSLSRFQTRATILIFPDANTRQDAAQKLETASHDSYVCQIWTSLSYLLLIFRSNVA